uniref:Protein FIZZY-RELATED 2-like n=1 Tax=Rhizophora mucronata TaxID=61149 RepID=A0A2P2JEW6_RHIMU
MALERRTALLLTLPYFAPPFLEPTRRIKGTPLAGIFSGTRLRRGSHCTLCLLSGSMTWAPGSAMVPSRLRGRSQDRHIRYWMHRHCKTTST